VSDARISPIEHLKPISVLGAMAWLLVGSIPGVLIGSQVSVGLPERTLRFALAAALGLSGLKLVEAPYANAIVVATFALGGSSSPPGASAGSSTRGG